MLKQLPEVVMAVFGFTRANGQDIFSIESREPSSSKTSIALNGEEVRQFYENLTKDNRDTTDNDASTSSSSSKRPRGKHQRRVRTAERQQRHTVSVAQRGNNGESEGNPRRDPPPSESTMELLGLRLLRCAHEGDISGLKDLLSKGADINFQDTFFWTAMMCASWSGQRAAVKLLLRHGAAWVGVVDTQGRDAKDLAVEAGHSDVLEELDSYGRRTQRATQPDSSASRPHWCPVCCSEYSSSPSSHCSSTLHQFSLQRPSPSPYYCLPPSSNSYKMMLRSGWKPGTGLGPEGEGTKRPVPTVLKRDQKGFGYDGTKRAKITHFKAKDYDAVKAPCLKRKCESGKGQSKEERRKKEQRDKNWERDFRASFYT